MAVAAAEGDVVVAEAVVAEPDGPFPFAKATRRLLFFR